MSIEISIFEQIDEGMHARLWTGWTKRLRYRMLPAGGRGGVWPPQEILTSGGKQFLGPNLVFFDAGS